MLSRLRLSIICGVLILLVGCDITPQKTRTQNTQLPYPEKWGIKAKLGVRIPGDNGGSVTLDWQQLHTRYTIKVQGPLGQGNAVISGDEHYITIVRPGETPLYSDNANELIQQAFGWTLPIKDFRFWVRGIANPEHPVDWAEYNPSGHLIAMQQSQWVLDYSRYNAVDQWQLPGKIKATQNDAQIVLIIREWELL